MANYLEEAWDILEINHKSLTDRKEIAQLIYAAVGDIRESFILNMSALGVYQNIVSLVATSVEVDVTNKHAWLIEYED